MNAKVTIDTFDRNGITYLKDSFASMPFKLMDVREDKQQPCLDLMVMSSSPGILDGDQHSFEINVKENCSLALQTQSYQRIYNMQNAAFQNMKVKVGKNAYFEYLPHPTVPHKNSNFSTTNQIYLAEGSTLFWSDLFSCGRKLNGESFDYTTFENNTTIYKNEIPKIIEHICFEPQNDMPTSLGQLEEFTHNGSIFIINETVNVSALKQLTNDYLSKIENIAFGCSTAPINGLIIKILANGGELLFSITKDLSQLLKAEIAK